MEKKKRFQIQMGWGGLFAFFITSTCILVWVFVMGFWLGQKLMRGDAELQMAQKPQIEDLKAKQQKPEPPKDPPKEPPAPEANMTSIPTTNEVVEKKEEPKITEGIKEEIITAKNVSEEKKPEKPTLKEEQKTPTQKLAENKVEKKDDKATKTQQAQQPQQAQPPSKEKPKEEVLKKYFAIQVASFNKKENAADEVKEWQAKGFSAQFREVDLKEKGVWYRVYVGRYKTLEEAKEGVKKIGEKKGQTAYIVSLEDK